MLKIGEFSWLSQVTVRTLRYYDEVGLLSPVHIDEFTGYRYYSLDQLPRLNRILALKDLGLPLEQIARILNQDLSADEIRGMLRLKQVELEDRMQEVRICMKRVEARIKLIEMEDKMPDYEVVLKKVEAQWVAFVREKIPTYDEVGVYLGRMFDDTCVYIEKSEGEFAGRGIAVWHDSHEQKVHVDVGERNMDVEAAVPIDRSLPGDNQVKVRELQKGQMASVVHHGGVDGLTQAKKAVFSWIKENGYRVAGPIREVYLKFDPEGDPADFVTEIQLPVEKV